MSWVFDGFVFFFHFVFKRTRKRVGEMAQALKARFTANFKKRARKYI